MIYFKLKDRVEIKRPTDLYSFRALVSKQLNDSSVKLTTGETIDTEYVKLLFREQNAESYHIEKARQKVLIAKNNLMEAERKLNVLLKAGN